MFHLNFISMPSSFVDVWKLDFRYIGVHRHGHYSNLKGKWCMSVGGGKQLWRRRCFNWLLFCYDSWRWRHTSGHGWTILSRGAPSLSTSYSPCFMGELYGTSALYSHTTQKSKKQYTVSRLEMKWTFNQNSNKICLTRHQEMQLTRIRLNNP